MSEEKAHHLFGGSNVKLWSNCPGYATLKQQMPEVAAGKAADEGTKQHDLADQFVTSEVKHLQVGSPKATVKFHSEEARINVLAYWDNLYRYALEESVTGKQILIEKKVMLSEELDAGGTLDFATLYWGDKGELECHVADLKTGRHVPESDQLLFYIVCLMIMIEAKNPKNKLFIAKASFFQPKNFDEPWRTFKFTRTQMETARKKYFKAINLAMAEKPKFKAGSWCDECYCPCRAKCETYKKDISSRINIDLEAMDRKLPEVSSLPDEYIVKLIEHGKEMESYISSARKYALQRFTLGNPIKGLKVVQGVGRRSWIDEDVAIEGLEIMGIADPFVKKVIGITEAEKRLGKGKIDHLTHKPPAMPKIVTESDTGIPIQIGATGLLEAFDDDVEF